MFIPDPGSGFFPIPNPGSRGQKSTGSRSATLYKALFLLSFITILGNHTIENGITEQCTIFYATVYGTYFVYGKF
jgi:hypothetical protein